MTVMLQAVRPAQRRQRRIHFLQPSASMLFTLFTAITVVFAVDGLLRESGSFDYWLINSVQDVDFPYLGQILDFFSDLTGTFWAITLWFIVFATFCLLRWWLSALATFMIPVAGGINMIIGWLVQRPRPAAEQLHRAVSETEATAFPSGHVLGAVLLYGLIFYVAGKKIMNPLIRLSVQIFSVTVIVTVGFARIWLGAHWVGDVVGAYTLGAALLVILVWFYNRIDVADGDIPFIHAAEMPHDNLEPHTDPLTSTILSNGPTVSKIYTPEHEVSDS